MEARKSGIDERYTYFDYVKWDDDTRWELINGVPYMMASPNHVHQEILMALSSELHQFLKGKPCKVYPAPLDVRLSHKKKDDNVVQPDIVILCDKNKLDDRSITGVPDMIIEILSPSNPSHDTLRKLNLYRKYGVGEYWIVRPDDKIVYVHILKDGEYNVTTYERADSVPVKTLEGCTINLADIFTE